MDFVVLPGDGIGPEISAATRPGPRGPEQEALARNRLRDTRGRLRLAREGGDDLPGEGARRGARGGRHHPRAGLAPRLSPPRAGRDQPLRASPGAARPLRQHPAVPLPRGHRPLRPHADGPGDRAREHRRVLRRPHHVHGHRRVHADPGRRHRHAQGDVEGVPAHRQGGLRAGPDPPAAEGDLRTQSQRAEDLGRACSSRSAGPWRRSIRTSPRTTRSSTR